MPACVDQGGEGHHRGHLQPAAVSEPAAEPDRAAPGRPGYLARLGVQLTGCLPSTTSATVGACQAAAQRHQPKALAATLANQVWSWDITYLPTAVRGQFYRLYMVMDIYSRKIVGWEVHGEELAAHAADLIDKTCRRERIAKDQLVLHADNGSPMKGATMLATLQRLGVVPSFSRPCVSDDNPYSEALFRTLKYTPAYPAGAFADIAAARAWVDRFVTWYNHEHRHSAIRFVTPAQRHAGNDRILLAARTQVYQAARQRHPDRWRGRAVRNWQPVGAVWLNPDNVEPASARTLPIAA